MIKRFYIFLMAAAIVLPHIAGAGIDNPPKNPVKVRKRGSKRPAVIFNHKTHIFIKGCKSCHKVVESPEKAHDTCRGCHRKQGGPVECSKCHRG